MIKPDKTMKIWAKPGGKNGRCDLVCALPGWKRGVFFHRVLGWYFLNKRHLPWYEYSKQEKIGKAVRYLWQVNHLAEPENCCLWALELGPGELNRSHYKANAKAKYNTVFRLPVKRPATAS